MTRQPTVFAHSKSDRSAALRAGAAWCFCGLLPPLAFRTLILGASGLAPRALDMRGALSDVASGFLVASALMIGARGHRWLPRVLLALWVAICLGDTEHILANGAHLQAAYAGFLADPTFLLGSALQIGFPLIATCVALATGIGAWYAGRVDENLQLPVRFSFGAALVLYLVSLGWTIDLAQPEWRQTSLFEAQIRRELAHTPTNKASGVPTRREPANLSGQWWPQEPKKTPNVLIIMLEAVSGAHIPSLAKAHGIQADPALPELDQLAREHIAYSSFIAQQRQTNRGEFALLCGDWPKLRTSVPRMSEYARETGPTCLPEALKDRGFTTVYLQAAPLGFMLKDQFMRRIGFERVLGNASFPTARSRTNWGVDDATLFEGALAEIEVLQKRNTPWMMTLLTVGTHHPYNVPKESPFKELNGFEKAARYADASLGHFISALEARGILEDTLVLITSDESRGLPEQANVDPITLLLSRNWSFLIALTPKDSPRQIDTPFAQSDLALSVLDYVAAASPSAPLKSPPGGGRSLFRTYPHPRQMAFANTYQRRIFHVDPKGELAVCREDLSACSRFPMPPNRPFQARSPATGELAADPRQRLRDWLFDPENDPPQSPGPKSLSLIGREAIPVLQGSARYQIVFGGQGLEPPANTGVDLSIDVRLLELGPSLQRDGAITIRANLLSSDQPAPLLSEEVPLEIGERLRLQYHIEVGSTLHQAEVRFVVIDRSGGPSRLVFEHAKLTVDTPGPPGESGPHRVALKRREIVSAADGLKPTNR